MFSATDFLPACITEFMNLVTTTFPNFGSGWISRFSALWRRDISFFLRHGRARPGHPRLLFSNSGSRRPRNLLRGIPGSRCAFPGMTLATLRSLRPFGAVFRAPLLAILHALRIEHAAQDVVAHARQILDAAAADHHHRMLLQVMALAGDIADDLEAIGQPNLGDLAQRRIRLLRRRRVDARADAAFLRALLQGRHLLLRVLGHPRLANELVDRRHRPPELSIFGACAPVAFFGACAPVVAARNAFAQKKSRLPLPA